jgi:hypothetical protein
MDVDIKTVDVHLLIGTFGTFQCDFITAVWCGANSDKLMFTRDMSKCTCDNCLKAKEDWEWDNGGERAE